jgi:hypothetical protein
LLITQGELLRHHLAKTLLTQGIACKAFRSASYLFAKLFVTKGYICPRLCLPSAMKELDFSALEELHFSAADNSAVCL